MSDIETLYLQYLASGNIEADAVRCQIIEDVLYQKLLVHHAKVDSTDVGEDEVNKELERRLGSFISQLGSEQALVEYYGKSILDIVSDAGLYVSSSCREGICGSCKVRLLGGEVEHRDSFLQNKEHQQSIMICSSRAKKGETLILDI